MNLSVEDILLTYSEHEEELKKLYGQHIKQSVYFTSKNLDYLAPHLTIAEK